MTVHPTSSFLPRGILHHRTLTQSCKGAFSALHQFSGQAILDMELMVNLLTIKFIETYSFKLEKNNVEIN